MIMRVEEQTIKKYTYTLIKVAHYDGISEELFISRVEALIEDLWVVVFEVDRGSWVELEVRVDGGPSVWMCLGLVGWRRVMYSVGLSFAISHVHSQ